MVDLAAPGSAILSTFPANMTNAAILKGPNNAYSASMMSGSSPPDSDGISGPIVFCSDYGQDACEGPGGHICLVQRGATSFEVKAANCEASGGIGVIIYNNIPNITLIGSLSESVGIPVLGMSAEDATSLYTESVGRSVFVEAMEGFALMDGTSMATPFVTGALAEIWRHCPLCSADEVESCLLSTTLPLEGNEYDYGFLQTR
jgi:serine protease